MSYKFSSYEKVFINMTKNYASVYPDHSFQYYFDDYKLPLIGDSKNVVTVKFKHAKHVFKRIFEEGSIGLGEVYCEGLVDVKDKDYKHYLLMVVRTAYDKKLQSRLSFSDKMQVVKAKAISSFFTNKSQYKDINSHYSLDDWFSRDEDSNQFYFYWLNSPYIQYTCAKWDKNTKDLEEAQINKFKYYAKRLGIGKSSKGKTMLDLGCGWGGLMFYFAEHYGIKCTGITLSTAQASYIKKEIKKRKLDKLIEIKNINVHDMSGMYDYVISVGLLEHIDDYDDLYKKTSEHLKPGGRALFHAMFHEDKKDDPDPFLTKYIFPGGCVTNVNKSIKIMKKYFKKVTRKDLPDLSYPKTLTCWFDTFCKHEDKIKKLLKDSGKCKDIDFAIRTFKHYLILSYCGLTANGLVCNILLEK